MACDHIRKNWIYTGQTNKQANKNTCEATTTGIFEITKTSQGDI